jgi:hypothetical protein
MRARQQWLCVSYKFASSADHPTRTVRGAARFSVQRMLDDSLGLSQLPLQLQTEGGITEKWLPC